MCVFKCLGDLRGSSFFGEVWLGFTYLLLSHSHINVATITNVATVTIAINIPSAAMVSSLNNDLTIVVVAVGI
jgi:hypothetical protein